MRPLTGRPQLKHRPERGAQAYGQQAIDRTRHVDFPPHHHGTLVGQRWPGVVPALPLPKQKVLQALQS